MQLPRRHFFRLLAGATAFPAASRLGWAQTYPSRPITMVIPYPPGGATDVVARILGQGMHASLGQPIIIENRGGANGSIGVGHVLLLLMRIRGECCTMKGGKVRAFRERARLLPPPPEPRLPLFGR